jgi:hypothetical protein
VLKLPLLVGLQHKVGELVLPITSCPTIIILENTLNHCVENVVMVSLTTGIMFLVFIFVYFWVGLQVFQELDYIALIW